MDNFFIKNYQYQVLLKIFHFQTDSYAGHKASDEHLTKVTTNFDELLETMQGKFGRIKFSKNAPSVEIRNVHKIQTIIDLTDEQTALYYELIQSLETSGLNNGIINILEEMIADNEHFIYLLSFE